MNFESKNAQGTDVGGIVYDGSGGPWTIAGSPYIVVDDVTVPAGETLTIEPGVEVKFDGLYSIYVDGNLIAVGNEMNRITITSNMIKPAIADWSTIQINPSGYAEIKYCNISHSYYAISCYSSNNLLKNNAISNNTRGIYLVSSSYNNITGNNIWSNPAYGIYATSSSNNNISNNNIWNNANGIHLFASSNNNISNNNISNNGHGFYLQESINDTIINNNISNNGVGIHLRDSSNINIINNNFVNDGVYFTGFQLSNYNSHNIPDNNVLNGKPLLYYKDTSGISIDGIPVGQVILANCINIEVKNIQLSDIEVGIQVAYSSDILIENNKIENNTLQGITVSTDAVGGISLFESSSNIITNNTLINNEGPAAMKIVYSSNNNIISNNNVSSNISLYGIGIGKSSYNIIIGNYVSNNNNGIGIGIGGDLADNSGNNIATNNNILNNAVGFYLTGTTGNKISGNNISENEYGVYCFEGSSDNEITGNTIMNNNNGIVFKGFSNGIITNNVISNNGNGIDLRDSSDDNVITSNIIFSNNDNGIHIKWSSNNDITGNNISGNYKGINISQFSPDSVVRGNTVSNNDYGVYIGWAFDIIVYHNNFINNTVQAYDETDNGNQWDNGYPSGGNYWSDFDEPGEGAYDDYNGSNQDIPGSDGIVDNGLGAGGGKNPYVIDSNSQDNYPLIEPKENFMFLYEGWNLISLPLKQSDTNVGVALSSISGSYKTIQWYNSTDLNDPWKHNCTTKPPRLNNFDSIDHLIGFWIFITQPGGVLFEYNGVQPGLLPENIPLRTGWNMVGFPSRENKNRTVGLNNLTFGVEVDAIFTFDAATQTWEAVGPGDDFELGRGYWVHATQGCVWDVPL